MLLIGAGQGLAFAPMTTFGLAGATASDAGAASGVVNTFHQVGSSLGLAILVAVAGTAAAQSTNATAAITAEAGAALTGASLFLLVSLLIVLTLVAPAAVAARRRAAGTQGGSDNPTLPRATRPTVDA
jgi:hypothetical protein